jgi:hypothetical protein
VVVSSKGLKFFLSSFYVGGMGGMVRGFFYYLVPFFSFPFSLQLGQR